MDTKSAPASPVHVRHKNGDGSYLSVLTDHGAYLNQNFILGQEFETFSYKGPDIESGLNTLNSLMTLRLNFNVGYDFEETAGLNGCFEDSYLKVFCLSDNFRTNIPGTGIMRTEM